MKTTQRPRLLLLAIPFLVASALLGVRASEAHGLFHFALVKSVPADKTTVETVPEVRLWFSEPPEDGSVTIRILTARGVAVKTGAVAADQADKKVYGVAVPTTLPNGPYSVVWRGLGDDGHALTDTLTFTVAARH